MKIDENLVNFIKALSDPTRLRILNFLKDSERPLCVNAIAGMLRVTQSAVSQHLRLLRQLKLVIGRRRGNFIHYEINKRECEKYKQEFLKLLE